MMTDDERNKLERMLQHDDDGSRKLAHMLKLLTELRSVVVDDRPDHALLLAEEVYLRLLTCRAASNDRREVSAHGSSHESELIQPIDRPEAFQGRNLTAPATVVCPVRAFATLVFTAVGICALSCTT
jgi:hypothetical protein